MNEIALRGCRSQPLASYLKALGVLRIVGEQADEDVSGAWEPSTFSIRTSLSPDQIIEFFLDRWSPSPIIAPWNGGSGFYPKDSQDAIEAISASETSRLSAYRDAIDRAKAIVSSRPDKPDKNQKAELIQTLRNQLGDETVRWIDAALLLTSDAVKYPALLGTGGNDGRLEFTNNFMQRVLLVMNLDGASREESRSWLGSALFGLPVAGLRRATVGQFSPMGTGGANATTGFEGGDATNPWDYVLTIEGALMFSAAATRRSESSRVRVSYPFSVESAGSGSGGIAIGDDATTRAEIWMPLWDRFIGVKEAFRLFSDGRLTVGQRIARDGVDAIRAIGQYGVDRGLVAFERFQFARRNGLSYLATPQGRIEVKRQPLVDLIGDLEQREWLRNVRRAGRDSNAPASLRQAVAQLESSIFELAQRGGVRTVERVLITIGTLHRVIARSPRLQESIRPVTLPGRWADEILPSSSSEIRVALALAGLGGKVAPIHLNLFPLQPARSGTDWLGTSTSVIEARNLDELLTGILARRILDRIPENIGSDAVSRFAGVAGCDLDSWLAFSNRELDERRIRELLYGLSLVTITRRPSQTSSQRRPLASLAMMKLVVPHERLTPANQGSGAESRGSLPRLREVLASLRRGRPDRAIRRAALHLRISERSRIPENIELPKASTYLERITSSLLVPLDQQGWRALEREIFTDDMEEKNPEEVTA